MGDKAFIAIVTFGLGVSPSAILYGLGLRHICTFHPKGIFTHPEAVINGHFSQH